MITQDIIDSYFNGPQSFYINTPILDREYEYGRALLLLALEYLTIQFDVDLFVSGGCLDSGLL